MRTNGQGKPATPTGPPATVLTAGSIEAIADFAVEEVPVPAWGGSVFVRTLTADQRDEFVTTFINEETGKVLRSARSVTATLLAMTVCNAAGELLYPDQEKGRRVFARKSAKATDTLFGRASELNALTEADIEDLAGNSPATASDGSPTGSA